MKTASIFFLLRTFRQEVEFHAISFPWKKKEQF